MAIPPGYMLVPAPGAMQVNSQASCQQLLHLQQHVEYLSSHSFRSCDQLLRKRQQQLGGASVSPVRVRCFAGGMGSSISYEQ